MDDTNELQAAVDRLRRVKARENPIDVYGTRERPQWFHDESWTLFDMIESAAQQIEDDHETLADAYLELGTRQPDEQRVYANGVQHDAEDIYDLIHRQGAEVKIVRVATFIQEIPEVPNAGT